MIYEHVYTYNLIFLCEERSSNAMYGCISPTLNQNSKEKREDEEEKQTS